VDALIAFDRSDSGKAVLARIPQAMNVFTMERFAALAELRGFEASPTLSD
jgi:hypothetical protein